jgi:hypothetical protein
MSKFAHDTPLQTGQNSIMGSVSLIGGPMDGRVVDSPPAAGSWLDVEGNRYVVRRASADGAGVEKDVGIFLPLYASAVAARRGRRAPLPWRPW